MLLHSLKMSVRALRLDAVRTLLMIAALGLGIGAAMTSATIFRSMAANPLASKEGRVLIPQIDNMAPASPYLEPVEPPKQLSYQDAMALWQARKARRQTITYPNELAVAGSDSALAPSMRAVTATSTERGRPFSSSSALSTLRRAALASPRA